MAGESERAGRHDDALLTALYLQAEQAGYPHEPSYDPEEGLLRFTAWLEQAGSTEHVGLAPAAQRPSDEAEDPAGPVSASGRLRADAPLKPPFMRREPRKPRRGMPPQEGSLLPRRTNRRWGIGNLLILACGADYRRLRMVEDRQRYITMGALMLLTTIQAFYCGASLFAMGFSRPFFHVIGYGLFLAAAVFFIDRSIVSYIAPRVPGDERSKKPRHSRRAIALRFIVAAAAAVLLTEVILLQVFAPRINVQLASDNLAARQAASSQISAFYQPQINSLEGQVRVAQETVSQRQAAVNQDAQTLSCELYGCKGTPAGAGPVYSATLAELDNARTALATAQADYQKLQAEVNAQVQSIEAQQEDALQLSARTTSASEDLLAREQAFWVLTVKYPEIAFVRILLTLLILSIDLAPVIVKVTSSYGAYEEEIRNEILLARLRTEVQAELQEKKIRDDAEYERQRQELDREIALGVLHGHAQGRQPGSMPIDRPNS